MKDDIRWQQRFVNFDRAYALLKSAMEERSLDDYSDLEKEGLLQRFEFSFELGWKTMKDLLEYNGIKIDVPIGPRSVIKTAFTTELIDDGQTWIDMMQHRNLLSHVYSGSRFEEILHAVQERYLAALGSLHETLKAKLDEEA